VCVVWVILCVCCMGDDLCVEFVWLLFVKVLGLSAVQCIK